MKPTSSKLLSYYTKKNILVTGGAGSIGSDIVKSLLSFNPRTIRVLDNNETALFYLGKELHSDKVRLLLGDIRDKSRLSKAVENVDIVFHAAALKHVPVCEKNPFEAVQTNVIGTQNLLETALAANVEKVIGISTDKAVNPISVMGASKLLVERLFLSAGEMRGGKKTVFTCVRFGNVMESRGSAVPIFKEQIAHGGPVTITTKEMTRFTMRIRDAVYLILQAGLEARGQEIFILKMPAIKITDLAEVMIESLAPKYGYHKKDIKVKYIGAGYQEKLNEELIASYEMPYLRKNKYMYVLDFSEKKSSLKKKLALDMKEFISDKHGFMSKKELIELLKLNGSI